ncbi:uncharacterized protein STEHIDRAFT_152335 [Stereum hirsutum FP-91666 SS1]|uniref:uncharacterized protein n=1 Tax=Stereum hirsutum (strain FP-91666) TaxID=721885 RepID=UPI000440EB7E|nr:uncharacterized protein STEHIDRAFT_152335 [Stereum hirsutum FP-91666 SS1]EIM90622.1 hypothetical protein STEHIDRAFT_152335 [Stereum hirsutum FP-91666 SS1]
MPSLGDTLGAIEFGVFFAAILYGVLLVQVYNYYQQHFNDGVWVKSLLYLVLLIETTHMAFITVYVYIVTVEYYGVVSANGTFAWTKYVWPLAFSVTLANLSSALVQGFFSYRMYRLSMRWYLPLFSWTFITLRLVGAIAASIVATSSGDLLSFFVDHQLLILLGQSAGLIVDIFNTICLCILLWYHQNVSNK